MGDVIDDNGTVGVSIVHRGQRLISLLTSGVPNLELDCSALVEGNSLRQEGGADGRFPVVIELVLNEMSVIHVSRVFILAI